MDQVKYYLVEAGALPEVFIRVAQAKAALESGRAATVGQATAGAGISRSAFYKYRDAIRPFMEAAAGRVMTFHAELRDQPGVLSDILGIFAHQGANIRTINQSIPISGRASVTLSAETDNLKAGIEELLRAATELPGVVRFEVLAG